MSLFLGQKPSVQILIHYPIILLILCHPSNSLSLSYNIITVLLHVHVLYCPTISPSYSVPLSYCPTVILSDCHSYCLTVPLSYCPTAPLSYCPTVLLSHGHTIRLLYCLLSYCPTVLQSHYPTVPLGQVETEETENGNGKLKWKTEAEIGNGKAEIGKWSSTFVALMASFAHARSIWG